MTGVTLGGVVNTSVTDWNGTSTPINDTGNVTQTLASLARVAGETVTAPGPTYAISSGVLNALGGSAAGNYSSRGALEESDRTTLVVDSVTENGTITTPGP